MIIIAELADLIIFKQILRLKYLPNKIYDSCTSAELCGLGRTLFTFMLKLNEITEIPTKHNSSAFNKINLKVRDI